MGYILRSDYKKIIQTDNLSQILGNDYSLLTSIEQMTETEVKSYLVQKYNIVDELRTMNLFSYYATYTSRDRIYLDGPVYSSTSTYAVHTLCVYNGIVYISIIAITTPESFNANHWYTLGQQYQAFYVDYVIGYSLYDYYTSYIVGDKVFYNGKNYTCTMANKGVTPSSSTQMWGTGTDDFVTGETLIGGSGRLMEGDTRNQQLVTYMTDIALYHLHSRIAPRNIPDLRVKRYDDSIAWLKQCAKGDDITADLPKIQPIQGMRNRYGSILPKQNNNF